MPQVASSDLHARADHRPLNPPQHAIVAHVRCMRGGERRCGRHGLLAALEGRAGIVGYDGADLASPPGEMARLVDLLARADAAL